MTKKNSHICSSINLFELQCRRIIKNCHVKNIYQQILSIWHISVNLHRVLFNLLVLIVNLNLYCSSEALDVRGNHLYCVCLTSVNYGHCGFRARWSCISIHRKFQHESSVFAERLPRGQASLQTKITWQVDESPFLIRELTFKTTNKWNIPYGKKKKKMQFPFWLIQT